MNKEKIKNIVIIVESAIIGLVATVLAIGGIKASSAKSTGISPESGLSVAKNKAERLSFKNMTDQEAYDTYFYPLLDTAEDGYAGYVLWGKGITNVWDTNLDFSFEAGEVQFRYYPSLDATSPSYIRRSGHSYRIYYHDVSYTYGLVSIEFDDGAVYDSYLKNQVTDDYLNYLPMLQFFSMPTPTDYSNFISYFYTYFSAGSQVYRQETNYVRPWIKIPWLNLYPSSSETFIVGYQRANDYIRVVANMSNLTCWGYTTNVYQSSAEPTFLGDLYFDYDGDLCLLPSGKPWPIYFFSSKYFAQWFKQNTFTSEEWSNGLYYLQGDMNVVTKYLYEDIEETSVTSGIVKEIDGLRYRVYKTNTVSKTSLLDTFTLLKTPLSTNDIKYTLRASGSDTRVTWADNTDAGDYIINYDDGTTSLNFKYGLSSRISWDNCVVSCQDTYELCRYFAPYYSTVLQDGKATTDGSSLTNSAFANTFILLGDAFDACFGWLNVEVFPGVTLFGLLMVPFIVTLIVLVFKVVKK